MDQAWIFFIVLAIAIVLLFWFLSSSKPAPTPSPIPRPPGLVKRFNVSLSGNNEVPPVDTAATGMGSVIVSADNNTVMYDILAKDFTSNVTSARFHIARSGNNGPVIKNINVERLSNNSYRFRGEWSVNDTNQPLTNGVITALRNGLVYVNVNTRQNPQGEIRGQAEPLLQ